MIVSRFVRLDADLAEDLRRFSAESGRTQIHIANCAIQSYLVLERRKLAILGAMAVAKA